MAGYTRERGREFWYDFDNRTIHQRASHPDMAAAFAAAFQPFNFDYSAPITLFRASFLRPDHPRPFAAALPLAGFRRLADEQQKVFDAHFDDRTDVTAAFADFGQGVLFDDRPPRTADILVHMMDGTPRTWIGYHRWHAFARGALAAGADESFWQHLVRCVAAAWTIQTEANPRIDARDNPGLPEARVADIVRFWLDASDQVVDSNFVRHRRAAPTLEMLRSSDSAGPNFFLALDSTGGAEPLSYAQVQAILERSTPTGDPIHGGNGRFWELPLEEFMAIDKIRGVQLIADPGADRGARSGLIRALKGEGEFGPGGFIPRMPRDLPPVPDDEIAYIQRWIDADCPP